MPRYVLLKHYRGAPAAADETPMPGWTEDELTAHVHHMDRLIAELKASGEYLDSLTLSPTAELVGAPSPGADPETRPVPEEKSLVAGWMIIDVAGRDRALELAAELSAAPGAGGRPVGEWLELRPWHGEG